MLRTLAILLIGVVIGVAATLTAIEVSGGRYEYTTIPLERCQRIQSASEVVPNQPNPCHFRTPRW